MLFHNITNSKDDRLCKKMIQEQEKEKEESTFYGITAQILDTLELDVNTVSCCYFSINPKQYYSNVISAITVRL